MKQVLLITLCFCFIITYGQEPLWKKTTNKNMWSIKTNKQHLQDALFYQFNIDDLNTLLKKHSKNQIISLPRANGDMEQYHIEETQNLAPELAKKYPNIKSFRGYSLNSKATKIYISVSLRKLQVMRTDGFTTEIIEPYTTNNKVYAVFSRATTAKIGDFKCTTLTNTSSLNRNKFHDTNRNTDDQQFRTFRTAVAVTGEYTQYHGGTVEDALAAVNATLTRVNAIYENDLAIRLELVANNDLLIYTDPTTDPFSDSENLTNWNEELQTTLTNTISEANYDVGHLFGHDGGGGNAGCIGCVCTDEEKGSAYTSAVDGIPEGDTFDIDYVAHEYGHQFGANHTFSRSENTGVNVEPGSGSTIMAYAGIAPPNVQQHSDPYFHAVSIEQIQEYIRTQSCQVSTTITNNPPVVNAGEDYIIPPSTPFRLTAIGSDPDNDNLTYTWEQIDSNSNGGGFYTASPTDIEGPNFRSFIPTNSPVRYLPSFENVISGASYLPFEVLSEVSRSYNFRVTIRDNNIIEVGQTSSDDMIVTVDDSNGPFQITSIDTYDNLMAGETYELTWNVAGTNTAPFNSPNVNIKASFDGGNTFVELISNTSNDGVENITIPVDAHTQEAIILIESIGNIFYAVSNRFQVGFDRVETCQTFSFTLPEDNVMPNGSFLNPGEFVVGVVNIPSNFTANELRVNLSISHPRINQVTAILQSPSMQQATVFNRLNCDNSISDLIANFDDFANDFVDCNEITSDSSFLPASNLSDLLSNDNSGEWLIAARDEAGGPSGGTFDSASITLCNITFEANTLSITDNSLEDQINIFPNPTSDILNLFISNNSNISNYEIINILGKSIKKGELNQNRNSIDISSLQTGIYFLSLKGVNSQRKFTRKIIKK